MLSAGPGQQVDTPAEDVLLCPVLLLNRHFVPVAVATARRALVLLFSGSARALDELGAAYDFAAWRALPARGSDDLVPVVDGALRVPRVVQLLRYDRFRFTPTRLTRRTLLQRDDYQCQYCGGRPGLRELNLDHVLPRSRGGQNVWENLVVSCRACNHIKGRRTPREAGMRLLRVPSKPHFTASERLLVGRVTPFLEWVPFLQA